MRIVSIEKLRRGGKFELVFDNGETFVAGREVLVDFGLRRGDEISEKKLSEIRDAQLYHEAYGAAARLVGYRMRTVSELEQRLLKKKFPPEIGARVIEKFADLGLLDDSRFAEAFVNSKLASKPIGRREMERRLREKGIDKVIAAKTISEVSSEESQFQMACRAADSKLSSLRRFDLNKRREKLTAFLVRRGFEWDVVRRVVRKVLKDNSDVLDSAL